MIYQHEKRLERLEADRPSRDEPDIAAAILKAHAKARGGIVPELPPQTKQLSKEGELQQMIVAARKRVGITNPG